MTTNKKRKAGYVALCGKPNVGKSTLLNALMGEKLAITSRKPQTTRQSILGIKTVENVQMMFVDTPGIHLKGQFQLNKRMNKVAKASIHDVDVVLWLTDLTWDKQDEHILSLLTSLDTPVILVINKIDHAKDKSKLLPVIEKRYQLMKFADVALVSALKKIQIDDIEQNIIKYLPDSEFLYPAGQLTDKSDNFMVAEMVREKLMRLLGQELPHRVAVSVESLEKADDLISIRVIIWVDKKSHKSIVIGQNGDKIKRVGTEARVDMEAYFGKKVFLKTWVKVKSGWNDNSDFLDRIDLG
jgi:GTPase